ncbi:MAG: lysophospholipid acyltransferase family protein [Gimesia sp.]
MTESDPISSIRTNHRNIPWLVFQWILQGFFAVWLRYQSRGKEFLPADEGGLLLSNHQSFLDPILICLPLKRPVSFMARDSLFRIPLLGPFMRYQFVIPISRRAASSKSFRAAIQNIEQHNIVGIFPEGTRTTDGSVQRFKPGLLALLKRTECTIYPVGIAGAVRALPRGAFFLRPRPIRVVYGEPITLKEIKQYLDRDAGKELLELTQQRVTECHKQAEEWLNPNLPD